MPALHRYVGTPFTTWILNRVYGSSFSDIHCGMRGITRDALERMDISSQSWEYASEMVLKSVHMDLHTTEVPVRFLKDRDGRLSHHKRSGWLSPFRAAWINLRAMFVYGADFFALKPRPGAAGPSACCFTLPLAFGPVTIGSITFSLYWMLLGAMLTILGLQSVFLGCIAQVLYDYSGTGKETLGAHVPLHAYRGPGGRHVRCRCGLEHPADRGVRDQRLVITGRTSSPRGTWPSSVCWR